MQPWGWDELLQKEGFVTSLPAIKFQVLDSPDGRARSYHLTEKDSHLLLDIILVEPEYQRQGLGNFMMEQIKAHSINSNKLIQLSVLKTNPAVLFHLQSGFQQISADKHSLQMSWSASI
jgi:ribosomal protein S18 acetylase RimI-like enzyme